MALYPLAVVDCSKILSAKYRSRAQKKNNKIPVSLSVVVRLYFNFLFWNLICLTTKKKKTQNYYNNTLCRTVSPQFVVKDTKQINDKEDEIKRNYYPMMMIR